jgi:peptidoglycan/xylan/chitin deacetylase (PgdA/CDA1 family)
VFSGFSRAQTVDPDYEIGPWQGFRSGAVSFTFDDNTPNQISVVLPMFDQVGFKMTFYPVINWGPNWTALQAAALNGHEVGSHTVSHASLSSLSNDQQTTELKNSQEAINSHIQGQRCLTLAYPNGVLGNASLCGKYYVAARSVSGMVVPKTPSDFMNISSIVCGSQGLVQRTADFTGKADAAASSNGWVVFCIHAVDTESGYSPTSSAQLKGALEYLSQNGGKFWVSTFSNIARYIRERNGVSVKQISANDSIITLAVTDTLDNSIFNYPLTIRRKLPQGWVSAKVSQNGKNKNSQIVNMNSINFILFDVAPDSGDIKLIKQEATGVSGRFSSAISSPVLTQNYPNPFNPVTTIHFQISENGSVTMKIYDVLGRETGTLVDRQLSPGGYSVEFDGGSLPGGLYLCRLNTRSYTCTRRLLLLK